ncbi:MAG TPA: PQQ-dependent sugar dehydrogenase [Rugosimonospora sp.]|nr:PQQ-dependent sugar dehydrogenase [Rugosimonospora sp.]
MNLHPITRRRLLFGAALAAGATPLTIGILDAYAGQYPLPVPPAPGPIGGFDFTRPEILATRLDTPGSIAFLPDGSALVAQRDRGTVLRLRPGTAPQRVAAIAGVPPDGEVGLLGLAISATFAQDGTVYAYARGATENRIARFVLGAPRHQRTIFATPTDVHSGGTIATGPDGMLYAAIGDSGDGSDAQDMSSPAGKILRMRPDGTVPKDNPFAGSLVYSLGHRGVRGLAWDQQGHLFDVECGDDGGDELNLVVPGGNYGWPLVDGQGGDSRYRDPILVWPPAEASPGGVAFANGTLFIAALRGERLWAVPVDATGQPGTPVSVLDGQFGRLRTVAVAPDGALWVATSNRDGSGEATAGDDRIIRIPRVGVPTPVPTASPTASTTAAPGVAPTAGTTPAASPTAAPSPAAIPSPTAIPSPAPTASPSPAASAAPSPTASPTPQR